VGILPALGEISKGLVERVGSLLVAFQAFHSPAISTTRTLSPSGSFNCRHPRVLIVAEHGAVKGAPIGAAERTLDGEDHFGSIDWGGGGQRDSSWGRSWSS